MSGETRQAIILDLNLKTFQKEMFVLIIMRMAELQVWRKICKKKINKMVS